jgi:hypothetical protein
VFFESSDPGLALGGSLVWEISVNSGVDFVFIEIVSELIELVLEISGVPEQQMIKVLARCGSDKVFDEVMRNGN